MIRLSSSVEETVAAWDTTMLTEILYTPAPDAPTANKVVAATFATCAVRLATPKVPNGAQLPSPRQKVEADALDPLFICVVAMFPVRTEKGRLDQVLSPRQKVVADALVPLFRLDTGRLPSTPPGPV